jgi:hypothetical protein
MENGKVAVGIIRLDIRHSHAFARSGERHRRPTLVECCKLVVRLEKIGVEMRPEILEVEQLRHFIDHDLPSMEVTEIAPEHCLMAGDHDHMVGISEEIGKFLDLPADAVRPLKITSMDTSDDRFDTVSYRRFRNRRFNFVEAFDSLSYEERFAFTRNESLYGIVCLSCPH